MAKRKVRKAPGMFESREAVLSEDVEKWCEFLEQEVAAGQSLQWLQKLRDDFAPLYEFSDASTDDSKEQTTREIFQVAESMLLDTFADRPLPEIVRLSYQLGRAFERWILQHAFDGMVANSRQYSRKQADIARGKASLTPKQLKPVFAFIEKRPRGVSVNEACKQVLSQLRTGTFRKLPGVTVELGTRRIRQLFDARLK